MSEGAGLERAFSTSFALISISFSKVEIETVGELNSK